MKKKKNDKGKKSKDNIIEEEPLSRSNNQLTVVSTTGYNMVSTTLPKNFFEGLLILEMELNDEFTMEKLLTLVNQYSLAIEFYLETDPMKAKAYQNRMEYLLTNKDTLVQLQRQKMRKNNENEKNAKIIRRSTQFNKTKTYVKLKQEDIKSEDISKKVNKVLDTGNLKDDEKKNVINLIEEDIKKQDESWKNKYKRKKKNKLRNSTKVNLGGALLLKKKFFGDKKSDLSLKSSYSGDLSKKNKKENNLSAGGLYEIKEDNNIIEEEKEEAKGKENGKMEQKENNNIIEAKKEEEKEEKIQEEKKDEENNKDEDNNNFNLDDLKEVGEEKIEEENKIEEKKEEENKIEEKKEEGNKIVEEKKEEENKIVEEKKEEENVINTNEKEEDNKEINILESFDPNSLPPTMNRTSILDEDMIRKIKPDDEISKSIEDQIKYLQNMVSNLEAKDTNNKNDNDNDNEEDEENEDNKDSEKDIININKTKEKDNKDDKKELMDSKINQIPAKFQSAYYQVESLMNEYMNDFNEFYYKEIFEQFSSQLRELYELKYKKYIEIRNEYHTQIKENEYLLDNDENLNEEKKTEIQQTIDSLNEEQQHQIATIEDEFNRKIVDKISEFKLNSFKKNSGIQLMEEQVKLDIYSLINDSFY